ncbi:MAG: D-alanyl-D-alanine carboxypeptidase [Holosporaceae bacterium]|nr:D-alanyl-D-alanine carboxypeptidase [Holosporaceae bacterium]
MKNLSFFSRYLLAFVAFWITAAAGMAFAYNPLSAAIVVNAKTGEVIYSYNADLQAQPASLAKMMTLFLTFKALRQKKISPMTLVRISPNAASQQPCALGLLAGKTITVRDAILSLITKSANDIAVALGEHVGQSEKKFVFMMNKEAQRLGMNSTVFINPSGWKNPRQLSTARDMAKLARALLLEYSGYYHLFSTKQFVFNKQCIKNHNGLLGKKGDIIVDGIKTGFLNASGFNLAASAFKGKKRLIVVVFGGKTPKQRDAWADLLLQKGFSKLSREKKSSSLREMIAKMHKKKALPFGAYRENKKNSSGIYNRVYSAPFRNEGTEVGQYETY